MTASHVVGQALGTSISIGAALVLLGAVALGRALDCGRRADAQPCGCMRITARDLGTARASWGPAVRAGLDARGVSVSAVSRRLGVSRQYVERLLAGRVPTIPVEHLLELTNLAGIDPAKHTRPNRKIPIPWQNPKSPKNNFDPA